MGFFTFLFWTALWGGIGIGSRSYVPPSPNQGLIKTGVSLAAACCYIIWLAAYLAQMNPLFGPQVSNITLTLMNKIR